MSEEKNLSAEAADVCEACGTIVELGSVIAADDTVLVLPFEGTDEAGVNKLAQKYIDAATERFATVQVNKVLSTTEQGFACELALTFECTAEKLIFEMGLSAL